MIKIFIADDHQLVRAGVRRLLEEEGGFEVVGEAADGQEVLDRVRDANPDILLLDVGMPQLDGVEVTRRLMREKDPPHIVILTMYADEQFAARLLRMGVSGYLVKDSAPSELAGAIRTVHEGGRYISASVRDALAMRFVEGIEADRLDSLSDREFQILRALASGKTNREIAGELSLSVKTIDAHRLNLLNKLKLRNNADLTRFAIQNGIIKS